MGGHGWIALLLLPTLAFAGCGETHREPTMTAAQAIELHADSLMAIPGVTGVYEGRTPQGKTVLRVMLLARSKDAEQRIPREIEGFPVEIEVSGEIEPMRR
jgi:hypothetical protein